MKYYIYKTTINDFYYIGLHKSKTPFGEDGYIGSGTRLKQKLAEYGKENAVCELLFEFDNEKDMIDKEKEIVSEELLSDKCCLNMVLGGKRGKGGWGFKKKNIQRKRTNLKKIEKNS